MGELTADNTTVVVSTFGGAAWRNLALARAVPSARRLGVRVVHVHAQTLHEARNTADAQVDTEWVVHLDADDELDPAYLVGMSAVDADVRAPAVTYRIGARSTPAALPRVAGHDHECHAECLAFGNWLVVGAAVRTQLVRDVGGWRDWPWSEDWCLWARCWKAGATIAPAPQAVYVAHARRASRNRSISHRARLDVHRRIAASLELPCP